MQKYFLSVLSRLFNTHTNDVILLDPILDQQAQQYLRECLSLLVNRELPHNWHLVPSSEYAWVAYLREIPDIFPRSIYFKLYLNRNRWERLKSTIRGSRARRARQQNELLVTYGFNAPKTYGWGIMGQSEFLLTQGLTGQGLADYIYSHWRHPLQRDQIIHKRYIIKFLALQIAQLHQAGFIHGDLRPNNILIDNSKDDPNFSFIDNERNQFYADAPPIRKVIKNLVQLNMIFPMVLTKTDRLRFYQQYGNTRELSLSNWLSIMDKVTRITASRMNNKHPPINE